MKVTETSLQFDEIDMAQALRANGWKTTWAETNWVKCSDLNPDYAGRSLIRAFCEHLHDLNLVGRNLI